MKRRSKWLWVTAIVSVVSMLFLVSGAYAQSKTYNALNEFNDKTNSESSTWQYLYNKGDGYKNLPVFYKDWGAWRLVDTNSGPYSNVYKSDSAIALHPDTQDGKAIDVAVAWKAPGDGKARIPEAMVAHRAYGPDGNEGGTLVWIEHSGNKYNESALKPNGSAKIPELTLDVKKGDLIIFAANYNKRNGDNETTWPIEVAFEGEAAVNNPKTGDAGIMAYVLLGAGALAFLVILMRKRQVNN